MSTTGQSKPTLEHLSDFELAHVIHCLNKAVDLVVKDLGEYAERLRAVTAEQSARLADRPRPRMNGTEVPSPPTPVSQPSPDQAITAPRTDRREHPQAAEIRALVKDMMGRNMSYGDMAKDLNARGFKTLKGTPWVYNSVRIWAINIAPGGDAVLATNGEKAA